MIERIVSAYAPSYAIGNSIDTRIMLEPLANAFVPVMALVHEFASYLPEGEMGRALGWATQSVFSADRVLNSARDDYPSIDNYRLHVLPQGPSELPEADGEDARIDPRQALEALIRPPGLGGCLSSCSVAARSFRARASIFSWKPRPPSRAKSPRRSIRFVWIGQRLPTDLDKGYFPKLRKQIARAGIGDTAVILDEVADLETAYRLADAFFLSSRLDPLPNVAIDSALRGLPVVCFEDCSGIADILATDPVARAQRRAAISMRTPPPN